MKISTSKKLLSLTLVFMLITLFVVQNASALNVQDNEFDPYSAFRLHIIANSDSKRDQNIKLAVRDAVLEYERELFTSLPCPPESAWDTRMLLMQNGSELLNTVKTTLKKYGADYSAALHIGEYYFPDRSYADAFYPAGEYRALRIVLGDGGGKNWWCVMFPPLCILEDDSGQSEGNTGNNSAVELKSIFVDFIGWISTLFSK